MNADSVFWIGIVLLLVLFSGEPDLHSAIVAKLMVCK